jgi:hypothetical protein
MAYNGRIMIDLEKKEQQTVLTESYDNWPTNQQSNSQPPEYKAGVLHTDYLRVVSGWRSSLVIVHFLTARLLRWPVILTK